jgi:hypothetical protein
LDIGTRARPTEERLAHEAPGAGRDGGVEEVAHTARAQLVGGAQVRRPCGLGRDAGHHVDHGVRPCGADGACQRIGVHGVGDDGLGAELGEHRRLGRARGHGDHLVAAFQQLPDGGRTDGPARSGEEDSHRVHGPSDEMPGRAVTTRVSQ